jgi:hypothetical protein
LYSLASDPQSSFLEQQQHQQQQPQQPQQQRQHQHDSIVPWDLYKIHQGFVVPSVHRIVLLTTGAMNPVHLGHLNAMERARQHMTSLGYHVVGGFMSPTHDDYVRPKMMKQVPCRAEFIRAPWRPQAPFCSNSKRGADTRHSHGD